jgi:hypothetical protein
MVARTSPEFPGIILVRWSSNHFYTYDIGLDDRLTPNWEFIIEHKFINGVSSNQSWTTSLL